MLVTVNWGTLQKTGSKSLIIYYLSHGPTDIFVPDLLELHNLIYYIYEVFLISKYISFLFIVQETLGRSSLVPQ